MRCFFKFIEIVTLAKNSDLIIIDPSLLFNYGFMALTNKNFHIKIIFNECEKSRRTDKVNKID